MPVRVWSGMDYLKEDPTAPLYGPPITFQRNGSIGRIPLNIKMETIAHKTGIIVDNFNTPCAQNVLSWCAASEQNYFTTNRFWLLLGTNEEDLESLEDPGIFLPPDSEVKVLLRNENKTYALLDVYKVAADKELKVREVLGNFMEVKEMLKGLQKYGSPISYRENLEGITFKTGLVIAFPDMFTDINDISLRHIDTISKVNNRLTLELANKLNMK